MAFGEITVVLSGCKMKATNQFGGQNVASLNNKYGDAQSYHWASESSESLFGTGQQCFPLFLQPSPPEETDLYSVHFSLAGSFPAHI